MALNSIFLQVQLPHSLAPLSLAQGTRWPLGSLPVPHDHVPPDPEVLHPLEEAGKP